jgi:hypothetical protein
MKYLLFTLVLISCQNQSDNTTKKPVTSPKECVCIELYDPVCADGKEYGNSCHAACAGAKNIEKGNCR